MAYKIVHLLVMESVEAQRLNESLRTDVENADQLFRRMGEKLRQLRDGKGYRALGYKNFAAYLKENLGISRARAYELIFCSEILDELSTEFDAADLPKTESVVRPLKRLPSEQRAEAWRIVMQDYPVPRRVDVSQVVKQLKSA